MDILVNGKHHPVTDKFKADVLDIHPDLSGLAYGELTTMRDALLKVADMRHGYMLPTPNEPMAPGGTLTVTERARLDNLTHVINVHRAVNFLQGRSHTEFGFEGVDQVHGNAHTHPCGCITNTVFDHHRRHEDGPVLHPHYIKHSCEKHLPLAGDFSAHYEAVKADNSAPPE